MFDLSWAETFIIIIIGLLVIGPDELPGLVKNCRNIIKKVKKTASDFTSEIIENDDVSDLKSEADKVNDDIKKIVDLEGNLQDTYNISDIMDEIKKK